MNVLIIEDEMPALRQLKRLLNEVASDLHIIATFDTVSESIEWLKNNKPDLIIADIHLADGKSLTIFERVQIDSPIIFLTAFNQYALDAFAINAVHYLLKPIDIGSLAKAINRVRKQVGSNQPKGETSPYRKRFLYQIKDEIRVVSSSDVLYVKSEQGVSIVHTATDKIKIDRSLDDLMEELDPESFFRVNRQFIVARKAIDEVKISFNQKLSLYFYNDSTQIPKERVKRFKKWLE